MVTDPVCEMQVNIGNDTLQTDHEGKRHYFCSQHCLDKFNTNPSAYLNLQIPTLEQPGVHAH